MICELEKRQDQLLQAKKLSSLGTFTSGIAHELNNPLNNISTSCQILIEEFDKADPEFSHRMLGNIEHEVHRARDIVRALLEFSRAKEFCLAPTPLLQVVDRAVKLISSQVPPGIEISLDIPGELSLDLDAQRMQQVFLNLMENAIHAMEPPGQISIRAGVDRDQETGGHYGRRYRKGHPGSGPGKDFRSVFYDKGSRHWDRPRLVHSFWDCPETSGIDFGRQQGKGRRQIHDTFSNRSGVSKKRGSMRGTRILIADDEPIARENLEHVLRGEGYETVSVHDGLAAIRELEKEEFDLVLTDIRMQPVDGIQVLDRARELYPNIEVIVITGYASVSSAVEAMSKGAYYYIAKPYQIDEVRVLVRQAIEKRGLRREVSELRRQVQDQSKTSLLIGNSPEMEALRKIIGQVAASDSSVLILGETGTGKELVARTIHDLSLRAAKRFLAINCGAFSEELLANELFGHEREAFTGAKGYQTGIAGSRPGGHNLSG